MIIRKILLSLFIAIFSFTSVFADYIPTEKDKQTVISLEKAVKKLPEEKVNNIKQRIPLILEKLDKNTKNYYLISEIGKILNNDKEEELKEENKENSQELYKVVDVIDGDTIHFMKGNEKIKARLIGIDAPESTTTRYGHTEENGKEATEKLKELIGNNKISVEYDESQGQTDKYGRDLIYIFVNGKNINEEMIRSGFAKEYTYKKEYKYQQNFQRAEQEAKNSGLGIWKIKENKIIEGKKEEYKTNYNYNNSYSSGNNIKSDYKTYHRGRKGGCFYYSGNKKKVYVDHSFCR